jgi:peptidoglycan hydrolase-like amidase
LYLGYDWEAYHHEQKVLIAETKGRVLTYNGKPVIGPYFTQSAGESSSKWVSQYPWTKGRKLPYDEGLEPKGHGVGLSGNSAHKLADAGKNYVEILNYFYQNTDVGTAY